jgi:hypothetical protein
MNTLSLKPTQKLLFFVAHDANASIRSRIQRVLAELAPSRTWVLGAPSFVDQVTDGDDPTEIVGGVLELLSTVSAQPIDPELDRLHLQEVVALVDMLKVLSASDGLDFEFELDHVHVGAIENGVADRLLETGLIGEWQKYANAQMGSDTGLKVNSDF